MVAGPLRARGPGHPTRRENLMALNRAALRVFDKGHLPIIGANMALPMIFQRGPDSFDALMMPVSLGLAERCDAILRIGGASEGADQEVERVRANGGDVYHSPDEIPQL